VLLDVHSYPSTPLPYELDVDRPRPAVCLGTDPVHTPPWLLAAARAAFAPVGPVDLDVPFAGTYVPLAHYRTDPRVHSVMLEIRRDVYLREPAGPPAPGLRKVVDALTALIDRCTAPRAERPPCAP
jgi:N-formylglutamate amidohydrolase